MNFTLRTIPSLKSLDFTAITDTEELANTDPFNPFYIMSRGSSLAEYTQRLGIWHMDNPNDFWCYVTNDETGIVAGTMAWNLNEKNKQWGDWTSYLYCISDGISTR